MQFNVTIGHTNVARDIFILKKYLLLVLNLIECPVFYLVTLFMIIFCQRPFLYGLISKTADILAL